MKNILNLVKLVDLKVLKDERGSLFEILRSDSELFKNFGQAYITVCNPGWVKGWHYHKKQTDYFCVVRGEVQIKLWDINDISKVLSYNISSNYPKLLIIPPKVVHGFTALGDEPSWILNIPDKLYNYKKPDEYRIPLKEGPEIWKNRKGG